MFRRQLSFLTLLLIGYSNSAGAGTNLALHKHYTLSPKPNYKLCMDDLDMIQLTDGKASGSNWTRKSTVGWFYPHIIPEITLDLGEVAFRKSPIKTVFLVLGDG